MSLVTQISNLVTRIGTEFKSVRSSIGSLASLTTTAKDNLVNAVNEVAASIGAAGATINDAAPSTTQVYSSSKTESVATAAANGAAQALISDASVSSTKVYSSQKVSDAIAAAISNLVNGADASMDTLKELADAITADGGVTQALTDAMANRLRFDAAQSLTAPQKVQGNANLGSASILDVGDVTTDFVALFNTALA